MTKKTAAAEVTRDSLRKTIMAYLADFYRFSGTKSIASIVILVFQGLTEGASILMLIPLMGMAGLGGQEAEASGVAGFFVHAVESLAGRPTLVSVLLIYVSIVTAYALLNFAQASLSDSLNQGYTRNVRDRLYSALTHANWLLISRTKSSDIIHVLTSEVQRIGSGTFFFLSLISAVAVMTVHIIVAFMLSVHMTSLILFCTFLLVLLMRPMNRHALQTGKDMHLFGKGMYGAVAEHLAGMKTAKSFGSEDQYVNRFRTMILETEMSLRRFSRLRAGTTALYSIGGVLAISILFYYAVEITRIPLTNLFILVFLFARILPRASQMHQMYQNMINTMPAFSATEDLRHRCEDAAEPPADLPAVPVTLNDGVYFKGVSFDYGNKSCTRPVLHNVNLIIQARRTTAVVGLSGAGKTTLADLLMGLIAPTGGEVLIDGSPLTGKLIHSWRGSVGYVPQETFLFHDTVRANLAWAKPEASGEEIRRALDMASATAFVENLPQGLDTVVGDRGIRLSGGERQRIALARAILRKPALLLLDEATSSLDTENEKQIQETIERLYGAMTIVVISHRLSTIRRADRIIVLKNGWIVEAGAWDELARIPGGSFQAMLKADERDVPDGCAEQPDERRALSIQV
jgi:ATP-binding cassette, subfamily C, bacterial